MKLQKKSKKPEVTIEDLYAVKVGAIWRSVRQQHISFWALTAYFFFEYVRPQNIYPVISDIPFGQVTLLTALFSVFLDRSAYWVSNVENKLFFLFFLIVALSGVFAFKPAVSWEEHTTILNFFLLYFLVINIVNTEKRLFIFLLGYMLFNFKMSQHGFVVWAGRGFAFTDWGLIGAGGYFQNSGEYSVQMLIFGALSLSFVIALRGYWGRYKKWFFYLMPFTAFMTVMGASSRGSQLALAVVAAVAMLKIRAGFKFLIVLIVLSAVLINFLPEEQKERFSEMGEDKTSTQRFAYWEYGIDVLNDNPVLGVGYENWREYLFFLEPKALMGGREEPHNIFIKVGAELGYPGLLLFILMILYVFINNARTRKMAVKLENKFLKFLAYGLDAGFIGYLVAGSFVTIVYYPFFWVQMAMTVALHNITKKQLNEKSFREKQAGKKQIGNQRSLKKLKRNSHFS